MAIFMSVCQGLAGYHSPYGGRKALQGVEFGLLTALLERQLFQVVASALSQSHWC